MKVWNVSISTLRPRGSDVRPFTHTHVFPNGNDTNKMSYIFQSTKTKIAEIKSACDVSRQNCTNSSGSYLQWGREIHPSSNVWRNFCLRELCAASAWAFTDEQPWTVYSKSLTQHSRPHTLDRLFSPILVEVLKRKEKPQWDRRNRKQDCEAAVGHVWSH